MKVSVKIDGQIRGLHECARSMNQVHDCHSLRAVVYEFFTGTFYHHYHVICNCHALINVNDHEICQTISREFAAFCTYPRRQGSHFGTEPKNQHLQQPR